MVLPGISAFDAILADLRLDPVVHGLQMYEATDLLLRRRPLDPEVPALIWQIGPLETCLHSLAVSRPERFSRLISHLRQYYPPRHEVVAIYCSPHPILPPAIFRFALEDMGCLLYTSILFIDEIHRFNKAQQDAFLPYVERGDIILIGATTENPSFEVNSALLSRSRVYLLRSLSVPELMNLLKRCV